MKYVENDWKSGYWNDVKITGWLWGFPPQESAMETRPSETEMLWTQTKNLLKTRPQFGSSKHHIYKLKHVAMMCYDAITLTYIIFLFKGGTKATAVWRIMTLSIQLRTTLLSCLSQNVLFKVLSWLPVRKLSPVSVLISLRGKPVTVHNSDSGRTHLLEFTA